jgi:citrate lyase subunit beta/citryl-CoA lyase
MHLSLPFRPRRSVLYVPGSNARAIDKARTLPCDAVVLDLEDSVAPNAKPAARDVVFAALRDNRHVSHGDRGTDDAGFGHRELIVRVNALDTEWGRADLEAVSDANPDAILVPKIRTTQDVLEYDSALSKAPKHTQLWVMIETALAIFRLEEIAATARATRLTCFVMGTNDLAKELRMTLRAERAPLAAMLGLTVAAARAHQLTALDGVYNAFDDDVGFKAQCQQGLEFGFDGKTLIHPRQVQPCNAVFSPDATTVEWATRVKVAFDEPGNAHKGVLSIDGKMVERLHLADAERVLALDAAIRATDA